MTMSILKICILALKVQLTITLNAFSAVSTSDLPRHTRSLLNRFRTGQGPHRANLHLLVIVASDRP